MCRFTALVVSVGLLLAAAAGCGGGASGSHARLVPPQQPLFSAAQAADAAQRLLQAVPRAPGTVPIARLPGAIFVHAWLERAERSYGRKSVRERFFTSGANPFATLHYIASHGPWKRDYIGWGETQGHEESWGERLDASWSGVSTGPRYLLVDIARGGPQRFAVRVSSVVAWHSRRPSWSQIPPGAHWLTLVVRRPVEDFTPHVHVRTVLTRASGDPSQVSAVADALDRLPPAEPGGPVPSCPAEGISALGPATADLTFAARRGGALLAEARVYPDECQAALSPAVWVRVAGHPRIALSVNQYIVFAEPALDVWPRLEAAFGVKLRAAGG